MRPMVLLFVALFNSIVGLSILFPILAPLGRELELSELQVGSLSTAYALMQFVMSSLWGKLSERRGRKPVLLVGILGFAVTFLSFGIVAHLGTAGVLAGVPLYVLLLTSRALGGALSSATIPTAQAYAADVSERKDRTSTMALIGAAFGLGVIFGPAIGAGLHYATGNLLAPVYFSVAIAFLNAIFVAWKLPEPERKRDESGSAPLASIALKIWPLLAAGFATTLASVAMEQTIAFYFQDRLHLDAGGTTTVVGLALMGYGVVAVFAQGFLVRRFSMTPLTLMRAGLPIGLSGFVIFVFATGYGPLIGALLIQGLGQGLTLPGVTSAMSLAVGENDQGSVAGLNSSAQGLARTLGPLVGTGLYEIRMELPYVFSAIVLALVFAVVLVHPRIAPNRLSDSRPR
jgi:MFS family permease